MKIKKMKDVHLKRGAAHRPASQRWPGGIIPYEIQPSICIDFRCIKEFLSFISI